MKDFYMIEKKMPFEKAFCINLKRRTDRWYRCIYPTHYEEQPHDMNGPKWKLGNYGFFGLGTTYSDYCYHHFRIGGGNNSDIERFILRCNQIIRNEFSTNSFKLCTDLFNNHLAVEKVNYDYSNASIEIYKPSIFNI